MLCLHVFGVIWIKISSTKIVINQMFFFRFFNFSSSSTSGKKLGCCPPSQLKLPLKNEGQPSYFKTPVSVELVEACFARISKVKDKPKVNIFKKGMRWNSYPTDFTGEWKVSRNQEDVPQKKKTSLKKKKGSWSTVCFPSFTKQTLEGWEAKKTPRLDLKREKKTNNYRISLKQKQNWNSS